ncbi:MAG: tetratricopeptide repeat protein [Pirellulales bacterium]|nr:tetratricopeptide repeat protein [Pirellulales bacterium]
MTMHKPNITKSWRLEQLPGMALLVLGLLVFSSSTLFAANEGQASLDEATEKKLDADSVKDLSEVIKLAERAIEEGLDETNTQFAKSLLTSTYAQRGLILAEAAVEQFQQNQQQGTWNQIRGMALQDLEKVLKEDDQTAEIYFMIAKLNSLPAGKTERAKQTIDKAVELSQDNASLQAQALVLRADMETNPAAMQADLDKAVKLAPKSMEIHRARGLFHLLKNNKPELALADFDKAAEIEPANPGLQHARGLAYMALNKPEEAIEAYDRVVELSNGNPLALLQRARAKVTLKKFDAAIEDLNTALEQEPGNNTILLLRARVYQMQNKTELAQADITEALKKRPGLPAAIELRGLIAADSGDFSKAIEDFEELLKLDPKNVELMLQIGILRVAGKQPRKAIEKFTAALEQQPDNFFALRTRADAYLSVGKHAEAIADYEKALTLKPKDSGVLNNLAWVLATSPEDSLRNGKRSIELGTQACEVTDYKEAHILSTLAAGYAESNDWENAEKWITKAVEAGADTEHKEQIVKEQASYREKKAWRELQNEPDAETPQSRVKSESEDSATPKSPQENSATPGNDAPAEPAKEPEAENPGPKVESSPEK